MTARLRIELIAVVLAAAACTGEDVPVGSETTEGTTMSPTATSTDPSTSTSSTSTSLQASSSPEGGSELAELQGRILFGRAGGQWGDATLFTANADGSEDERIGGALADYQTEICCMRWSPDGTRIAFDAFGLFTPDPLPATGIIESDGSSLQVFEPAGTFLGSCDTWSRATDRMACFGGHADAPGSSTPIPDSCGVYTVSAVDGGDPRPVHTDECDSRYVLGPLDFSPDGSQLVMLGKPIGARDSRIDSDAPLGSLYVANVDGTDFRAVTPDGVHAWSQARWSPDGEWILFSGVGEGGPVWAVRPDGADFHVVYQPEGGQAAAYPTWSPDGQFILFALDPRDTVATLSVAPHNKLCVVRADGTDLTCIIDTPDFKIKPDWAAP